MTGPAWLFLTFAVIGWGCFVVVSLDREQSQTKALTRQKTLSDLMARHAALIITLRVMGYPVPSVDVVDLTDLDRTQSPADISWIPEQREGR